MVDMVSYVILTAASRHGTVDLAPYQWNDGDYSRTLDGDQAHRRRTISYHALFTFDVIMCILFVLVSRYTTVGN
jgi:hypothetical protein